MKYNSDPNESKKDPADELRRDIVAFANTHHGYIFFGIQDTPIELIGITPKEVDIIKNVVETVINLKVDPKLNPNPNYNPVPLKNGKYILGIEISPKENGIYGIRKNSNPNNSDFETFEFWKRMNGQKKRMTMDEVNLQIINNNPNKKRIQVKLLPPSPVPHIFGDGLIVLLQGTNKSIRPITITTYDFIFTNDSQNSWFFPIKPPDLFGYSKHNTKIPCKLNDGEICDAFCSMKEILKFISKNHIKFPVIIQGLMSSTEGIFYSNKAKLIDEQIWVPIYEKQS